MSFYYGQPSNDKGSVFALNNTFIKKVYDFFFEVHLMKKAELSMTVIIGAAIALLILVLLSVLVLNTGEQIVKGTGCSGVPGAFCIGPNDDCSDYSNRDEGTFIEGSQSCTVSEDKCCVPLGS